MFDAHCHLDLLDDPADAAAHARRAGVVGILIPGVLPEGWAKAQALAATTPGVWWAPGLHPCWLGPASTEADLLSKLEAAARSGAVAIGETGLDGRTAVAATKVHQQRMLRAHLALARDLDLPVILHVVRAHEAALRVCREDGLPAAGAMVHGFTGSAELAVRWAHLGCHLSIGGPVTWFPSKKRIAGIRAIPAHRLLVETDAPDQAPDPWRRDGEPGAPAMLPAIIRAVAALRGECESAVAVQTADNAANLLRVGQTG